MKRNKIQQKKIKPKEMVFNKSIIESNTIFPAHKWKIHHQDDTNFSDLSEPIDMRLKKIQIIEHAIINESGAYHYLPSIDKYNKENIDQSKNQKQTRKAKKTSVEKISRNDLITEIQFETYPVISLFEIEIEQSVINIESDENQSPNSPIYDELKQTIENSDVDFIPKFNYSSFKTYTRSKKLGIISNKDNDVEASTSNGKKSKDDEQEVSPKKKKLNWIRNFKIPKKNWSLPLSNQSTTETNAIFDSLKK